MVEFGGAAIPTPSWKKRVVGKCLDLNRRCAESKEIEECETRRIGKEEKTRLDEDPNQICLASREFGLHESIIIS
jgi:hypothetical protein